MNLLSGAMNLDAVLSQYGKWRTRRPLKSAPEIISHMHWGTAHRAVRVRCATDTGREDFVVRFLVPSNAALALDFRHEILAMQRAAEVGLAPKVVYVLGAERLMVTEYIEGSAGSISADSLGKLIAAIHRLPATDYYLDLASRLEHYTRRALESQVDRSQLIDPGYGPLKRAIRTLSEGPKALCHNDLNRGNILIKDQRPYVIDWEYAAMGSPYFDTAAALDGSNILNEEELLRRVFPRGFSPALWQAAKAVYAAIEWNWYQAAGEPMPAHCREERVTELLAKLP